MKKYKYPLISDDMVINDIVDANRPQQFSLLYAKYYQKVYSICFSIVKNSSEAQELTHDVLLKAYVELPKLLNRSSFAFWIQSIAYRLSLNHVRKHRKINALSSSFDLNLNDIVDEVDDDVLDAIDEDKLNIVLELIKPEEKAVLLMKYKDGFSLKDMETILQVSSSCLKMRLKRAKAKVYRLYLQLYASTDFFS